MRKYVLYLNSNGDGFHCSVNGYPLSQNDKNNINKQIGKNEVLSLSPNIANFLNDGTQYFLEFSLYNQITQGYLSLSKKKILLEVNPDEFPNFIREAVLCESREEVMKYINQYLIPAEVKGISNKKYFILNEDGSKTKVVLYHTHFKEKEPTLCGHNSIKGRAHRETPQKMLEFTQNRNAFFKINYQKGQEYQKTSVLNPSWILTALDYYFTAFKNNLANTLIGAFIFGIEATHYCEDFNLGYQHPKDNAESESSYAKEKLFSM